MNKRWVVTFLGKDGNYHLAQPAQGRYTYETSEEAYSAARSIMENNDEAKIAQIWGPQSIGSFGVRRVECWPGHNDPVATVY